MNDSRQERVLTHSVRLTPFALIVLIGSACAADAIESVSLQIGSHPIQAEIANTPALRELGLMHRTQLAPGTGMLFIFERNDRHCFWMKSTPLPLSIAFIDEQGRIASLADMAPHSTALHCPPTPIRYALEVTQGDFQPHNIAPGMTVRGLPR